MPGRAPTNIQFPAPVTTTVAMAGLVLDQVATVIESVSVTDLVLPRHMFIGPVIEDKTGAKFTEMVLVVRQPPGKV